MPKEVALPCPPRSKIFRKFWPGARRELNDLRRLTANLDRKVARLVDGLADGAPGGDGAAAFRKAMAEISEE
jgi:hypothetical protein